MADLTKAQKEQIEIDKKLAVEAAVKEALAAKAVEPIAMTDAAVKYLNEKVPCVLPLIDPKDPQLFVAINGKKWIIKRGKHVMIPRYLKNHLDEVEAQRVYIMELKARLKERTPK